MKSSATAMTFDFCRYVEDFNRNDDESFVLQYFTPDVVIVGPDRTLRGRAEWLAMLKVVHNGVQEEIRPLLVVREGDRLMAELDIIFTPSIDRPDFPFDKLKAGVALSMRFFASYRLRDEQLAQVHLAFWTPGERKV